MRAKVHDIQWPVRPKTIEDINTNFDTLFDALSAFERTVAGSTSLHEILSYTHSDVLVANRIRGDILTAQGAVPKWARLAKGAAGTVLTMGASEPQWSDPAHNLLSATHSDTLAGTVVRGDVIIGNATPKWSRLAKGTTGTLLTAGASDVSWATHAVLSASHTDATAAAVVRGDVITGQGATPKWTRLALSVPAATFINVLGIANAETESSWKALFDATVPTTITVGAAAATGSAVVSARRDHVHGTPATYPATAHAILSATHSDTTPEAVARGDIIIGAGVSPAWTRLALGGPTTFLHATATDVVWATISTADLTDLANIAFVNASNTFILPQQITYAGANWLWLKTTTNNVIQLALQRDETAGSYNVTWNLYIPASSKDFRIQGAGSDWLTITSLGVASFGSTLAWGGGAAISSSANVAILDATNTFLASQLFTSAAGTYFKIESTANNIPELIISRNQLGGSYNETWELYMPSSSTDLHFYANGADRFTITNQGVVTVALSLTAQGTGSSRIHAITTANLYTELGVRRNESGGSYNVFWELYIPQSSTDLRFYAAADLFWFTTTPRLGIGVAPGCTLDVNGATRIRTLGAFAAGDKYVIADASGNLHVSATGPAS